MHTFLLLILLALSARNVCADGDGPDATMAPDFKHQVVLEGNDPELGYSLSIMDLDSNESLLSMGWGGYAVFKTATWPDNFKCLWSPDSRFVALLERGTKRSADTILYYIHGTHAQEVAVPDFMPLLPPHFGDKIRAIWVRPEVWLARSWSNLSVEGTRTVAQHAVYRFILTLQLCIGKNGKAVARIGSLKPDHTVNSEP